MNTETKFQTVGKYKVDVADETNQAIRFVEKQSVLYLLMRKLLSYKIQGYV